MANSYIDPSLVRMTLPEGPGWEWNPGATFVTAFNNAQENQRLQQKRAEEAELAAILLPYQQQKAALELDKLQQEVERSTLLTQKIREAGRTAHRGIMQGIQNPNQAVSGSGGDVVSQDQQPQQQLGYSNRLRKTGTGTLGSGLQPIQPVGGN